MKKGFTITYEYGGNLYVNTTNRCNFNCNFCLRHNNSGGSIYTHNLWLEREPTREEILEDIEQGKSYVCLENEEILAVFFYQYGYDIDPTYRKIVDGSWIGDNTYGVVHRIAARAGSGAGKFCIRWAYSQCGHLRIDTHADNRVMQKVLEGLGFTRCGIIYIEEDNDPRIAFEKV